MVPILWYSCSWPHLQWITIFIILFPVQIAQLFQADSSCRSRNAKDTTESIYLHLVFVIKTPSITGQRLSAVNEPHRPIYFWLGHQNGSSQRIGLPLVPIFLRSQDTGTIFPNFRSLMAGYLSVIGIQLKQYLMGALMCQRKPAFSAEFPNCSFRLKISSQAPKHMTAM